MSLFGGSKKRTEFIFGIDYFDIGGFVGDNDCLREDKTLMLESRVAALETTLNMLASTLGYELVEVRDAVGGGFSFDHARTEVRKLQK